MPINVKTEVFEGPLDLLLELIEKRKLLINDVSLAAVTDEYIEKISGKDLPVGETAEFVALAATLLLIKSRSLLPTLELSPDESRDIKELEYRLAVYQLIKESAKQLDYQLNAAPLHEGNPPAADPMFLFDSAISIDALRRGAQSVIEEFPKTLTLPKVAVKKIISIEDMIERMAGRVSTAFRMSFKEFADETVQREPGRSKEEVKHEIIVGFLALLELVKQGILKAHQGEHFSDITLESDSVSTPTYE